MENVETCLPYTGASGIMTDCASYALWNLSIVDYTGSHYDKEGTSHMPLSKLKLSGQWQRACDEVVARYRIRNVVGIRPDKLNKPLRDPSGAYSRYWYTANPLTIYVRLTLVKNPGRSNQIVGTSNLVLCMRLKITPQERLQKI